MGLMFSVEDIRPFYAPYIFYGCADVDACLFKMAVKHG